MQEYIDNNRKLWDGMVPVHVESDFYDVPSFKAGRSSLKSLLLDEVGSVAGKTMLHLQCHFGMDTLSWARLGAQVTGVDFSGPAIEQASELAKGLGIDAKFIESDIYKLPDVLDGQFDIVFASYGVICWLPDFPRWAEIAAYYVKPGGFFYLADDHPITTALDYDANTGGIYLSRRYSSAGHPEVDEADGSYADPAAILPHKRSYTFNHSIGEVVTSLAQAGLRIDFLHEFPSSAWQRFPDMTQGDDGYYHSPDEGRAPLTFSVRASRR